MEFSLFYFSGDGSSTHNDKYRLLIEGATFADRHGFAAIWTPERHFHDFGGLYPNPALMGVAIAMITQQIQIRAGSVVLPLQHPLRVAEEWAVVDNLSNGRVGIAVASGWHPNDFVLYPEKYGDRKSGIWRDIQTLQALWRGNPVEFQGGAGNPVPVKTFPRPLQPHLPIWVTALAEETFWEAGKAGLNILTSPLYQSLDELTQKIKLYRKTLAESGHDPQQGKVTVMLHTFIGEDNDEVKEKVRIPFGNYLRTHFSLVESLTKSLNLTLSLDKLTQEDLEDLFTFSFESYFNGKVLMGSPATCRKILDRMQAIGVDEIAALIDFGVQHEWVMESLHHLNRIREHYSSPYATLSLL